MKIYKEDLVLLENCKKLILKKEFPFQLLAEARNMNWVNLIKDDESMIEVSVPPNLINFMLMSTFITQYCNKLAECDITQLNIKSKEIIASFSLNESIFNKCLDAYTPFYNRNCR